VTPIGVVAAILTVAMGLSLYRVLAGPTIFDRLTGLSLIGTKSIILLLLFGVMTERADVFVDITLAYALISFVGILTIAKYIERQGERR
jgi:multicomponent Na+:H+ antiporter subunit F